MPDLQRARLHRGAAREAVRPGEHERSVIGLAQAARAGQGRRDRRHRRCTRLRPVAHAHRRRGARQGERVALDRVATRRELDSAHGHGARARIHRDLARRAGEDRRRLLRHRGRGRALGVRPDRAGIPRPVAALNRAGPRLASVPEGHLRRAQDQIHRLGRLIAAHRRIRHVVAAPEGAHAQAVARQRPGVAHQPVQPEPERPRRAAHIQNAVQGKVALHREQRRRARARAQLRRDMRPRHQGQGAGGQGLALDPRQGSASDHRHGSHRPGAGQRRPGRHHHRARQRAAHRQRPRLHHRRPGVAARPQQGQRARTLLRQGARPGEIAGDGGATTARRLVILDGDPGGLAPREATQCDRAAGQRVAIRDEGHRGHARRGPGIHSHRARRAGEDRQRPVRPWVGGTAGAVGPVRAVRTPRAGTAHHAGCFGAGRAIPVLTRKDQQIDLPIHRGVEGEQAVGRGVPDGQARARELAGIAEDPVRPGGETRGRPQVQAAAKGEVAVHAHRPHRARRGERQRGQRGAGQGEVASDGETRGGGGDLQRPAVLDGQRTANRAGLHPDRVASERPAGLHHHRAGDAAAGQGQRAADHGRRPGIGVRAGEGEGAVTLLVQGAGAGDDSGIGQVVRAVEDQLGVVRDVALHGARFAAIADLQRAGRDRGATGVRVLPGQREGPAACLGEGELSIPIRIVGEDAREGRAGVVAARGQHGRLVFGARPAAHAAAAGQRADGGGGSHHFQGAGRRDRDGDVFRQGPVACETHRTAGDLKSACKSITAVQDLLAVPGLDDFTGSVDRTGIFREQIGVMGWTSQR
ncbi:hypothetical protein KHHGKMAE_3541 [Methylobacterium persicinum]|nr:hypothetical protein KHHGKMAE_3541 [Methylobacterium persicinum]